MENFDLSRLLKKQSQFSFKEKLNFVWKLSLPGILAQISSILMQYIDAAMVGNLGANEAAAIGLVASSTWIIGGLISSICIGFSVQVAQAVGEGNRLNTKLIFNQSVISCLLFSFFITVLSSAISFKLPVWLKADISIHKDAILYFLIFSLSTPFFQIVYLFSAMLQSTGNMKLVGLLNILMCLLDVAFNAVFIYGFKMGVAGAALGTCCSAFVCAALFLAFTYFSNEYLGIKNKSISLYSEENNPRKYISDVKKKSVKTAFKMAVPIAIEKIAFTGALVAVTRIIAPLGPVVIASNSFATTAEALCYMPGYGFGEASTTLTGQSIGAKRKDLAKSFAWISVLLGVITMSLMGLIMYFICPWIFKLLSSSIEIQELSAKVLRIELFAEPFYAASIVAMEALRGAEDTIVPCILNLISIWLVRITLSLILINPLGLTGIWIAMAIELTVRGILMLIRLLTSKSINS